jgi:hypothetical protein
LNSQIDEHFHNKSLPCRDATVTGCTKTRAA